MVNILDIRDRLNTGLEESGGATVNLVSPNIPLTNCFVIGGAGINHTESKDYFYALAEHWIEDSIDTGATHVGVWLDPETGLVHYDSLTVITINPEKAGEFAMLFDNVVVPLAEIRNQLAFGYFGTTGQYRTINVEK